MAQKAELRTKLNLDSTGFKRGIQRAKMSVASFGSSVRKSLSGLPGMFAGIIGVGAIKSMVELGASAEETASKFRAVFGRATGEMTKEVEKLTKIIPATEQEMQNALATFGAMAKAFGFNEKAARLFSVELVKIGGDLASFHDLKIEDMFQKIRSAISGEFEPLKQLGIVVNEARLKQEGLNLAIFDGVGTMTAAQKALAVQSLLIRDMGEANGDAEITADSAANKIKFLRVQLKETATSVGDELIPAFTAFLKTVNSGIGALTGFGQRLGEVFFMRGFSAEEFEAVQSLEAKGHRMSRIYGAEREELIRNEIAALKESRDAYQAARSAAIAKLEEENKLKKDAIENSEDLAAELKKQIEAEKDPQRKEALENRLRAHEILLEESRNFIASQNESKLIQDNQVALEQLRLDLINAQIDGNESAIEQAQKQLDLEIETQRIMRETNSDRETAAKLAKELTAAKERESEIKPKTGEAGDKLDPTDSNQGKPEPPKDEFNPADVNRSGYVTPREQRAFDRKKRQEDKARRARERAERAAEVEAEERRRQEERNKRMEERERAAGFGVGAERKQPSGETAKPAQDKTAADMAANVKTSADALTNIEKVISENP